MAPWQIRLEALGLHCYVAAMPKGRYPVSIRSDVGDIDAPWELAPVKQSKRGTWGMPPPFDQFVRVTGPQDTPNPCSRLCPTQSALPSFVMSIQPPP